MNATSSPSRTYSLKTLKFLWKEIPSPKRNISGVSMEKSHRRVSSLLKMPWVSAIKAPADGTGLGGGSVRWVFSPERAESAVLSSETPFFWFLLNDKNVENSALNSENTT